MTKRRIDPDAQNLIDAMQEQGADTSRNGRPRRPRNQGDGDPARRRPQDVIREHWQAHYRFAFKRDGLPYSSTCGRVLKRSELLADGPTELLNALENTEGASRDDARAKMPNHFKRWAPHAFADLVGKLSEELAGPVVEAAAQEFRRAVTRVMFRMVRLAHFDPNFGQVFETRSVVGWCSTMGKSTEWTSVKHYRVWCRRAPVEPSGSRLAICFRAELAGQVGESCWRDVPHARVAVMAQRYGVGQAGECRPGGNRAVELDPGFVEALLATPDGKRPDTKRQDDASATNALAREENRPGAS
jgi:hypothetical protein